MTREELKEHLFNHHIESKEKGAGGSIICYMIANDVSPFFCTIETACIDSSLNKEEFLNRLNDIQSRDNFIYWIGEKHPYQDEIDRISNTPEGLKLVERNKKIFDYK